MSNPTSMTTGSVASDQRRPLVASIFDAVRSHVRRVVPAVRGIVGRFGDRVESFVGTKIKRRVKPPIVLAIVVAGLALAAAVIALIRK